MCHCMLLADPDMLFYWMTVYFDVLHIYYICMQIIYDYKSICAFMYGMSISLNPPSYSIETKRLPFGDMCNALLVFDVSVHA